MGEKDYIISLIDKFLENPIYDESEKGFVYFKNVYNQIRLNKDSIYDFVVGINDDMLSMVFKEDSDVNKFKLLKEKVLDFKRNNSKISLNKDETIIKDMFFRNIYNIVKDFNKKNEKYELLKLKFDFNVEIDEEDYDLVERLIYLYNDSNADSIYEKAMDYLNRYNITLIRSYSKKSKKEVVYKKVGESISGAVKDVINESSNLNDDDSSNFFEMVNFDYTPKERSRVNKKRKKASNVDLSLDELLLKYDIIFNDLNENLRNMLLSNYVYSKYFEYLEFIKNSKYNYILDGSMIKTLVYLLSKVSLTSFKKNLSNLSDTSGINDLAVERLLKVFPSVFLDSEYDSFNLNVRILNECGIDDISDLIVNHTFFFFEDYTVNLSKLERLRELGINSKAVLKNSISTFILDFDLIIKNIGILDSYGFDLRDEADFKSFSILSITNLPVVLDIFIEMGLSKFIHDDPTLTLRNIKSLVIKRILYAYKNNISVWDNASRSQFRNVQYERKLINRTLLSESEICDLISEYPILRIIENLRELNYSDSYFGSIRRKTEIIINEKIFSRLKIYSVFSVLVRKGVDDKSALLYSVVYNSLLSEDEYMMVKNFIENEVSD